MREREKMRSYRDFSPKASEGYSEPKRSCQRFYDEAQKEAWRSDKRPGRRKDFLEEAERRHCGPTRRTHRHQHNFEHPYRRVYDGSEGELRGERTRRAAVSTRELLGERHRLEHRLHRLRGRLCVLNCQLHNRFTHRRQQGRRHQTLN